MTRSKGKGFAVWTPSLEEVHGQNLVTRRVVERQADNIARIHSYPVGGGGAIPRAILSALRLCFSMLLREYSGIYIVCSRSTAGFLRDVAPLAMSLLGYRVIVHVHGSDFPSLLGRPIIGPLARLLYLNCDVVVPSAHLLLLLDGFRFRRLYVCENFASPPKVLPDVDEEARARSEGFRVLWNSNLMASKGLRELVGGLHLLRDEGLAITLVVLGAPIGDSEASESEMSEFVATLASEEWVDVKGRVSPEEVADHLDSCDAVALPSTYVSECQPLSIVQAMLAGRIVLVTPTAALRATVGTYPAVFSERSSKAIATALRPYAAATVGQHERIVTETEAARRRFSPVAFDARIGRILSGRSEEDTSREALPHLVDSTSEDQGI